MDCDSLRLIHFPHVPHVKDKHWVLEYATQFIELEGYHLEFGVHVGLSLTTLAKKVPTATWHGFDSWAGIPEEWNGMEAGYFTTEKPDLGLSNVLLYDGWFDDSLPMWIKKHPPGVVAFVHFDGDLYKSTKGPLNLLKPYCKKGTVFVFDEYYGYPNYEYGEYRAFHEFLYETGFHFDYIASSHESLAVKLV